MHLIDVHLKASAKTDVRHEARLVPLSFRNASRKCITILGIWYKVLLPTHFQWKAHVDVEKKSTYLFLRLRNSSRACRSSDLPSDWNGFPKTRTRLERTQLVRRISHLGMGQSTGIPQWSRPEKNPFRGTERHSAESKQERPLHRERRITLL